MIVYHGSDHIVEVPVYNGSRRTNDYGYGFYTTESLELAKEWACANKRDGFANKYEADLVGLQILNLNSPEYSILNWLALLTHYRSYWQNGSIAENAKDYLQQHFYIDPSPYDIIVGYRADDSYFSIARSFLQGALPLEKLEEALRPGKLGEQVFIKSEKAFKALCFLTAEAVDRDVYLSRRILRDQQARQTFKQMNTPSKALSGTFAMDFVRNQWKNNDERLS